jgi:hypothetical protein
MRNDTEHANVRIDGRADRRVRRPMIDGSITAAVQTDE